MQYRFRENNLYKEIQHGKHMTQAWESVGTMDEVYTNVDIKNVQPFTPNRLQWSFSNGIYTASNNQFWEYGKVYEDPECPFNTKTASIHFLESEFPIQWKDSMFRNPQNIPCEGISKILQYQQCSTKMQFYIWALLGRLLRTEKGDAQETADNWNVILNFYGQRGTGKETIARAFSYLYPSIEANVVQVSKTIVSTFPITKLGETTDKNQRGCGLSDCKSSLILAMPGSESPLNLVAGRNAFELQSKHAFGVHFPRWVTAEKRDPNLDKQIFKEIGWFIVKANTSYLQLRKEIQGNDFWASGPPIEAAINAWEEE